ncbi:MAG TPA: hypothetical protein VI542_31525 [Candidatus Tectomicrobia bacterium]
MRGNPGTPRPRVLLTYQGQTQPLAVWARSRGMSPQLLGWRLRHGWSIERALTTSSRLDDLHRSKFVQAVTAYLTSQEDTTPV